MNTFLNKALMLPSPLRRSVKKNRDKKIKILNEMLGRYFRRANGDTEIFINYFSLALALMRLKRYAKLGDATSAYTLGFYYERLADITAPLAFSPKKEARAAHYYTLGVQNGDLNSFERMVRMAHFRPPFRKQLKSHFKLFAYWRDPQLCLENGQNRLMHTYYQKLQANATLMATIVPTSLHYAFKSRVANHIALLKEKLQPVPEPALVAFHQSTVARLQHHHQALSAFKKNCEREKHRAVKRRGFYRLPGFKEAKTWDKIVLNLSHKVPHTASQLPYFYENLQKTIGAIPTIKPNKNTSTTKTHTYHCGSALFSELKKDLGAISHMINPSQNPRTL